MSEKYFFMSKYKPKIDPYAVLGLPHSSSLKVVRSAYTTLIKTYHPDIYKGNHSYARERLQELKEAFDFLKDFKKKICLDEELSSDEDGLRRQCFQPQTNLYECQKATSILETEWVFACDYHPRLSEIYADLKKIDRKTAFAFMALIVKEKLYDNAEKIALEMERSFLGTNFGEDLIHQ